MNSPLQRKPPNAELCPSCQTRMAPECGCCSGRKWIAAAGAALLALAGSAAFLFGPEPEGPSPEAPVAAPEAAGPVPSSAPGAEMPPQPVPAPVSIPEEITDQKTELGRVDQDAEQALRRQLDESEPLCKINEPVELRQTNGFVDHGTLTGFSGTGTGRVVLIATPIREIGVFLESLDSASRRRLDPASREAYIAQKLSAQKEQKGPEKGSDP